MTHQRRPIALLAALLIVLAMMMMPPAATRHTFAQDDDATLAAIDQMLNELAADEQFSGAVLIARDGDILLSAGYGLAHRGWEIPNTPATKFRIGSVTKQFTGLAILKLQEEGRLSVEDAICTYLDECPAAWQPLTIRHLLTHTAGIPNLTDFPDYPETMSEPTTPAATMQRFADRPLEFEPGTSFAYSNSGYILLGIIIEAASGQPYAEYLQDNFFSPLGMENTGLDSNSRIIPQMAEGYANPQTRAAYVHMSVPYAAGALYSTVGDLYRWTVALHTGKVVSAEAWESMWENAYTFPDGSQYGYGLSRNGPGGRRWVGHGGGINGFASMVQYLPAERLTIVVLSNLESANPATVLALIEERLF
jgi:CubicO group peptidase (beta-lactamase class C family)